MHSFHGHETPRVSRRDFLALGCAAGFGCTEAVAQTARAGREDAPGTLVFGVVTDLHYADRDPWGTRHYRDSRVKLAECVRTMNAAAPAFLIELGDIIDKADRETETGYLRDIGDTLRGFRGVRYHVLGNHDVATFSKDEFLDLSGARDSMYAFDAGEYRGIVLDGNFNPDGGHYRAGNFDWTETYIHAPQREWLAAELARAGSRPVLVFIHQNLHEETDPHGVKNAPEVRRILEAAGNVRAVFQGHNHAGGMHRVGGIPYVTFAAAVEGSGLENNAYALVAVERELIRISGYGRQKGYEITV